MKAHDGEKMLRPFFPSACPECGGALVHQEGCVLCSSCGFSPC